MKVNISTDIDENIQKLNEMLQKLELVEDKSKMLNFITISQFAEIRGVSLKTARDLFNEPTFPSEDYGKNKVVELQALKEWYMVKRSKNKKC